MPGQYMVPSPITIIIHAVVSCCPLPLPWQRVNCLWERRLPLTAIGISKHVSSCLCARLACVTVYPSPLCLWRHRRNSDASRGSNPTPNPTHTLYLTCWRLTGPYTLPTLSRRLVRVRVRVHVMWATCLSSYLRLAFTVRRRGVYVTLATCHSQRLRICLTVNSFLISIKFWNSLTNFT